MSYEDAPSTRMLDIRCAICSRPLRDAISAEIGMGRICREKYGYDAEVGALAEESRAAANAIIHRIAAARRARDVLAEGIAQLRALGFSRVAQCITSGGRPEDAAPPVPPELVVMRLSDRGTGWYVRAPYKAEAVPAWREVSAHRFLPESREWFVSLGRRADLWALLAEYYAGHELESPRGTSTIPARAQGQSLAAA